MSYKQRQGRIGEQIALRFLEAKGWRCAGRNVRTVFGEIDLVMYDGATTVFVEVKFRRSLRFGTPEEALTAAKRHHLAQAITAYVQANTIRTDYRCDLIALVAQGRRARLRHYKNIDLGM